MSEDGFFKKSRESQENFRSFDFTEDSRASKRGYDEEFQREKGNAISGIICRDPKVVQVPSDRSPSGKEDKLILTIEVDEKTKGWTSRKDEPRRTRFDINNPDHKILTLWVPETGNMTTQIDNAAKGKLGQGQYIYLELVGLKDTGKQNLARQFKAEAGSVPVNVSRVSSSDLDDDGDDEG